MEKVPFDPQRWQVAAENDRWKVAYLGYCERFGSLTGMERHLQTDEVFVLLEGEATLYTRDEGGVLHSFAMAERTVYNVKRGVWHHIVASEGATVLIVENANTTKENTERMDVE